MTAQRKLLLRLGSAVPNALRRSAGDDLASVNAQVEVILRRALTEAGRMPRHAGPPPAGRPPQEHRRRPGPVEPGAAGA